MPPFGLHMGLAKSLPSASPPPVAVTVTTLPLRLHCAVAEDPIPFAVACTLHAFVKASASADPWTASAVALDPASSQDDDALPPCFAFVVAWQLPSLSEEADPSSDAVAFAVPVVDMFSAEAEPSEPAVAVALPLPVLLEDADPSPLALAVALPSAASAEADPDVVAVAFASPPKVALAEESPSDLACEVAVLTSSTFAEASLPFPFAEALAFPPVETASQVLPSAPSMSTNPFVLTHFACFGHILDAGFSMLEESDTSGQLANAAPAFDCHAAIESRQVIEAIKTVRLFRVIFSALPEMVS